MSARGPTIYEELVAITHTYLGPATERFINRQVHSHLNKAAEDITAADLRKLLDWIRIAVSLLTADSAIVEEYMRKLQELAGPASQKRRRKGGKS